MKVLHVIPSVSEKHGGPTYALQAFSRALQMCGVDVAIATTDDDGGRRRLRLPLGQPIERRGVQHFFFRRNLLFYKVSLGLARWLNDNVHKFDLVHIHALFSFSSYAAARAARKHRVPYIVRPLGVLNRWGMKNRRPLIKQLSLRFIELPILRQAGAVHYTSEAERRQAVALRPEIESFPSFVLPIPVDPPPERVEPDEFVRAFPAAAGKSIILFLSRLDPKKGLEILFEAFASVHARHPDALLVIAGDGNDEYVRSLRALVDRAGVQSNVLWAGHLDARQKAAAFAAATVFVLPSYSENFGIAAAEALAAGVPTISSDQVALADEAMTANAALVVPVEPRGLAKAMLDVLIDPMLRQRLSANGRSFATEKLSLNTVGASLLREYSLIIGGGT